MLLLWTVSAFVVAISTNERLANASNYKRTIPEYYNWKISSDENATQPQSFLPSALLHVSSLRYNHPAFRSLQESPRSPMLDTKLRKSTELPDAHSHLTFLPPYLGAYYGSSRIIAPFAAPLMQPQPQTQFQQPVIYNPLKPSVQKVKELYPLLKPEAYHARLLTPKQYWPPRTIYENDLNSISLPNLPSFPFPSKFPSMAITDLEPFVKPTPSPSASSTRLLPSIHVHYPSLPTVPEGNPQLLMERYPMLEVEKMLSQLSLFKWRPLLEIENRRPLLHHPLRPFLAPVTESGAEYRPHSPPTPSAPPTPPEPSFPPVFKVKSTYEPSPLPPSPELHLHPKIPYDYPSMPPLPRPPPPQLRVVEQSEQPPPPPDSPSLPSPPSVQIQYPPIPAPPEPPASPVIELQTTRKPQSPPALPSPPELPVPARIPYDYPPVPSLPRSPPPPVLELRSAEQPELPSSPPEPPRPPSPPRIQMQYPPIPAPPEPPASPVIEMHSLNKVEPPAALSFLPKPPPAVQLRNEHSSAPFSPRPPSSPTPELQAIGKKELSYPPPEPPRLSIPLTAHIQRPAAATPYEPYVLGLMEAQPINESEQSPKVLPTPKRTESSEIRYEHSSVPSPSDVEWQHVHKPRLPASSPQPPSSLSLTDATVQQNTVPTVHGIFPSSVVELHSELEVHPPPPSSKHNAKSTLTSTPMAPQNRLM
ncbi:hypothetical protein Tcan_10811 [Toxocara canis]|uniref:Uncharacterized protein n=1 Tax=Toxocara canis TaxID=6265 RepID=A0A0B2UX07_TOXCA|nr:hypothetical protein Tcan_10811 [Toxocara canis]